MKPRILNAARLSFPLASAIAALLAAPAANATNYYWDTDGATAGAGGSSPSGTWSSGGATWSSDAAGTTAATPTTALTDDLFFSAGTNATGAYTITVNSAQSAKSLTIEEGAVTFGGTGTITLGASNSINTPQTGITTTIGNNTNLILDGTNGLTKNGAGTLLFNGNNGGGNMLFTGGISLNGGTLTVDYTNRGGANNYINTNNALTLGGGGTFGMITNASNNSSQTLNGVSLIAGGGTIKNDSVSGSRTSTLTLGAITATTAGGSLNFLRPSAGVANITTTNTNDATGTGGAAGSGILSGRMTNNQGDFANVTAGTIGNFSGYTTTLPTTGSSGSLNYSIAAGITLTGSESVNTLKIAGSATALALGGNTLTINGNGLLSTGSTAQTISGTTGATRLTAGNVYGSYDLIVHQFNTNALTISAVIGDNVVGSTHPTNLVKAGTQPLILSGINTYTGNTYVNAGILDFTNTTPAGSGRNIFVAPGAIAKFNSPTTALMNRIAQTNDEIGIGTATGSAAAIDFSATGANLPNAFLAGGWAGNGAKTDNFTGTITPANNTYRLGFPGATGSFGVSSLLSGASNGLIVGNSLVVLTNANTFGGETQIRSGAGLCLANALAIQNSALNLGSGVDAITGYFGFYKASGSNITNATEVTSATLGGLIGSRALLSAYNATTNAFGNNAQPLAVANVTGFTLNPANGATYTFSGAIAEFGPATTLTKTGLGSQILAGANTYSGTTTLSAGTLMLGAANVMPDGAGRGNLVFNPSSGTATFDLGGFSDTINGLSSSGAGSSVLDSTAVGTPTLTVGGNNQTSTFGGIIQNTAGTLSLTKIGSGTQTLTNANTYSGATTINAGTLAVAVNTGSLSSSSALTLGGGTLQLTGTGTQTLAGLTTTASTRSSILLGANQTLTFTTGAITFGSGSSLNINTASGGANGASVGSGLVVLGSSGYTPGNIINSGFTVTDAGGYGLATVNGSDQVIRLTTGSNLLPASGATSATDYLVDNNNGGAAADGSSSLIVTTSESANSITVDTTAASGVLTLDTGVVLSNNTWNFGGTGSNTYQITGSTSGAGISAVASNDTIGINNFNPGIVTIASPILANGTNDVIYGGTGTTVLTGASLYTGNTTLNAGTINLGVAETANVSGPLGKRLANAAGSIILNGGTLQYSAANTNDYSGRFSTAANQAYNVDTNGQTVTWATALSSSGGILTKSGTGTLNLTSTTYAGGINISEGTLKIATAGQLGAGTYAVNMVNNGSLQYSSSAAQTISGNISGTGSVTKDTSAASTLTLSGNNTYQGGTFLSAGTLLTTADANLGTGGGVTVNGTSTWNFSTATAVTYNRTLTINSGTLTLTSGNAAKTVTGVLSGSGSLVGAATTGYIFSNTGNSFTGTVNNGYQMLFASLGDSSNAINLSGSNSEFQWTGGAKIFTLRPFTLNLTTAAAQGTFAGQINNQGTGPLTIKQDLAFSGAAGARTLQLNGVVGSGANTFAGNIANFGASAVGIIKTGTSTWNISGNMSNTGGVVISGGTLTLSGTNTYSGQTQFSAAGTTLIFAGTQAVSPNTSFLMNTNASTSDSAVKLLDDTGNINNSIVSVPNTFTIQNNNSPGNAHTFTVGNNNTANGGTSSGTTTGGTIAIGTLNWNTYAAGTTAYGPIQIQGTGNGYRLQIDSVVLHNAANLTSNTVGSTFFTPTTANVTLGSVTVGTGNVNLGIQNLTLDGTSSDNRVTGIISNASDFGTSNRALRLTKSNTSTWTLSGANTYTGTTSITGGTLIALSGSALGTTSTANVTVATQTGLIYNAATDTPLSIGGTLGITGGTSTLIGGSIGSTTTSAQISSAGNATATAAAIKVNIYGNTFSTTVSGTNTYTLVKGNGGTNTLSAATSLSLGSVFNNTNFTVGTLSKTASTIDVGITQVAALTGDVYWKGGLAGNTGVWSASNGTSTSNWQVTDTVNQPLVPGATADLVFSTATSPGTMAGMTLGSDMTVRTLKVNNTATAFGLISDSYTLTLAPGASSDGITLNAGLAASPSIGANIKLGAAQTWTNNSGRTFFVTGNISGAGIDLTTAGANTTVLSGLNTYTGNTLVSVGTLQFTKQTALYNNGAAAAWSNTNINVNSGATMAFNIGGGGEFTKANILTLLGLSNGANGFKTGSTLGLDTTSGNFLFDSVIANPNSGTNVLGLTKLGTNTLTLNQANTYSGDTSINAGTLKLDLAGSIANSANVTIASNTTLDVSTVTTAITLGSGQTLKSSATGANTTATVTTVSGKDLTLSSGGLGFTAYDGTNGSSATNAPLTVTGASAGELKLNGAPVTVTTTSSLAIGTYVLVAKSGSALVTGTPGTLTLNGSGAAGAGSLSVISGQLVLTVGSAIDHFAISTISSPQTVGSPISGITLTAQDASNATVTTFSGTVTFSGSAGITGTSGSFTAGVLTGVTVTPSVVGASRTFIVTDGVSGKTGTATFDVQSLYDAWANGTFANAFTDKDPTHNPDGDTLTNLQEYAFGTDPTTSSTGPITWTAGSPVGTVNTHGTPVVYEENGHFYAVYGRRVDYSAAGLTYTPRFSVDLISPWASIPIGSTPEVIATDSIIEAVRIEFGLIDVGSGPQKARFFDLGVSQ